MADCFFNSRFLCSKFLIAFIVINILSISFFSTNCFSQNLDLALKSYQNGDYDTAKKILDETLAQDADNTLVLYNLGLTEYKLGNPGKALAYWRKAINLSPGFSLAEDAINYAKSQMRLVSEEDGALGHKIAAKVLSIVPAPVLYALFLITLFIFLKKTISYIAKKRQALLNDQPLPSFSFSSLVSFFVSLLLLYPVAFSYFESLKTRATVITKVVETKSSPNLEAATLYTLNEGESVIVLDKIDNWYKIKDRSGRLGWAQQSLFFLTSVNK
jgi:tetratricopeptide (TPR) repeat protein